MRPGCVVDRAQIAQFCARVPWWVWRVSALGPSWCRQDIDTGWAMTAGRSRAVLLRRGRSGTFS
jgi:hypothetical protein